MAWILAHEQEEEEDDDEEGEGEEEDDGDEEDDKEEEDDEEEEEKNLKEMEKQRSQGKVRDFWTPFFPPGVLSCFLSDHLSSFQSLQVKVTPGKVKVEDPGRLEKEEKAEEKRLAIMMMKKKEKYLYDKIMFGKKRKVREVCFFFKNDLNMDLFRSDC